jgi:hypothetical protein
MENLFLQAMGDKQVESINKIKKNKEFLRKLIRDLQDVYTLYVSNQDDQNSTTYNIKKFSSNRETIFFTANENGCRFHTEILGYRDCNTPSWNLNWIVEKYDTCTADDCFMSPTNGHGRVKVNIHFTDTTPNLMDIIRDIARILDKEKVAKKF